MEHGRLSGQRSKAITREVGELCRRVRPVAGDWSRRSAYPRR
jgi:acyl-CoA oxidase